MVDVKDIDDSTAKELLEMKNSEGESVFPGFKPVRCLAPCSDCGKDVVVLLTEYETRCRDCWKKIEDENPVKCHICGKTGDDMEIMMDLTMEIPEKEDIEGYNFCSKNCLKEFVGEL